MFSKKVLPILLSAVLFFNATLVAGAKNTDLDVAAKEEIVQEEQILDNKSVKVEKVGTSGLLSAYAGDSFTVEEAAELLLENSDGAEKIDVYVSPNGKDDASGLYAAPFATIDGARLVVREVLKTADKSIMVHIAPGKYVHEEAVVFEPEDSGTEAAPVTYRALLKEDVEEIIAKIKETEPDFDDSQLPINLAKVDGKKVILTGAKEINPQGWTIYKDNVMVTTIEAGLEFDALFVNDEKQILSRYPNYDSEAVFQGSTSQGNIKSRSAGWADPAGGYIRAIHNNGWGGQSYIITGKNSNDPLGLSYTWVGDNNRGASFGNTVLVENIKEEVDSQGEFFYDNSTGELIFYPPNDVDLDTAYFEAAVSAEILQFKGEKGGETTANITIDGVTIQNTKRTMFTGDYVPLMRGDWCVVRTGAILLQDSNNISIVNSHIHDIGGNAIFLSGHNVDHLIDNNEIIDIGSTGVLVAGLPESVREPSFWQVNIKDGKPMPDTDPYYVHKTTIEDREVGPISENYPRDIIISKNHIQNVGLFEKQSCGVSLSVSHNIKILQNTIHGSPRAGININDGTFGGHEIAYNDVFDCQRETHDHGLFNSWGRDRFWSLDGYDTSGANGANKYPVAFLDAVDPVVIHDNRWHHDGKVASFGIDLDDGSSNYEIYNNLGLNQGIKLREGFGRKVYNNIFVSGKLDLHCTFEDSHDLVEKNIWVTTDPHRLAATSKEKFESSKNTIDKNWFFDYEAIIQYPGYWEELGYDANSINDDPGFINPRTNNYEPTNQEAMDKIGFVPFPMDQFGKPGCEYQSPVYAKLKSDAEGGGIVNIVMREQWLGATTTAVYDESILSATGTSDYNGVFFDTVPADSRAEEYGFRVGDIIKAVNGQKLGYKDTFEPIYREIPQGAVVSLDIVRDQSRMTISYIRQEAEVLINDNNEDIVFVGDAWSYSGQVAHTQGSFGRDITYINAGGSSSSEIYFEYTFKATQISYVTRTEDNMGDVKITITDSNSAVKDEKIISCISSSQTSKAVVYTSPILPMAEYTIKVEWIDGAYFILDGLITYDTLPEDGLWLNCGPAMGYAEDNSIIAKLIDGENLSFDLPLINKSNNSVSAKIETVLYNMENGYPILESVEETKIELAGSSQKVGKINFTAPENSAKKRLIIRVVDANSGRALSMPFTFNGSIVEEKVSKLIPTGDILEYRYLPSEQHMQIATGGVTPSTQVNLYITSVADNTLLGVLQSVSNTLGQVSFAFDLPEGVSGEFLAHAIDEFGIEKEQIFSIEREESGTYKGELKATLEKAKEPLDNAGEYSFIGWIEFEDAYHKAFAIFENQLATQDEIDSAGKRLSEAMQALQIAEKMISIYGSNRERVTIYRADSTEDGGNTDGNSADKWQRRSEQVDTTHPGGYAVVTGSFKSFAVYGANKSDSVRKIKIIIEDVGGNVIKEEDFDQNGQGGSATVKLVEITDLTGAPVVIKIIHAGSAGNYMELRKIEFTELIDSVPTIENISLTPPTKVVYDFGEPIDLTGGYLTIDYGNNNTVKAPLATSMISGFDASRVGVQTIAVKYKDFEDSFDVEVQEDDTEAEIVSITLTPPTKLNYLKGEALSLAGGYLTIKYDNNQTVKEDLKTSMISGYDFAKIGVQTIKVKYKDFENTFEIKVKDVDSEAEIVSITLTAPSKVIYLQGEELNLADGYLTVKYDNNQTVKEKLNISMISGFNSSKLGMQTLTVSYKDFKDSFKVYIQKIISVSELTLSDTSISLKENATHKLVATINSTSIVNKAVAWSSSNTSIATVDKDGIVKGILAGEAVITVTTSEGGLSAKCKVIVTKNAVILPIIPDYSGSSAGSSSGSRGGTVTSDTTVFAGNTTAKTTTNQVGKTIEEQIIKNNAAGNPNVALKIRNVGVVTASEWAKVQKLENLPTSLYADSINGNGAVSVRVSLNPKLVKKDLNLAGFITSDNVSKATAIFNKYFSNKVAGIELGQNGSYDQRVKIAMKVDLKDMDTEKLVFYSYDLAANQYRALVNPNYFIDANGYLQFYTDYGNIIIVSEGSLAKKQSN